jgi:alkylation response protein AidB-like acyl-CoA dehydrogenase
MELAMDIANATGMIHGGGPLAGLIGWEKGSGDTWGKHRTLAANDWISGFLFSPALTIGGGTAEVQRNVIAERILGLPRDVD